MTDEQQARRVDHYENFPVASWLCPPALRPPIAAIYWFARTADDLADEGDAPPEARLADLDAFGAELDRCASGQSATRWPEVFGPLQTSIRRFRLPVPLLHDLLSAFRQDVLKTSDGAGYADRAELLDYCRRSANPIGRLLLHLHDIEDGRSLRRSDAICSSLQLVNFWQDLSRDLPRGRRYLPDADCAQHGIEPLHPELADASARAALLRAECAWARKLMLEGAPLVHALPGRAGWELRLVVQGGLRILDKIEAQGFDTITRRPAIAALDAPALLWRAVRM
ncbi:squalene synthase HpnC [Ramlibacter algicola]|uniref:Squalene synthase HpnC n=1 Tax=Ramlibacter algicola TaxID=2795217 RepID=A0A934Q0N2_9BURK|nr:squalene synthase HpnC [Ramlibacter algicola]